MQDLKKIIQGPTWDIVCCLLAAQRCWGKSNNFAFQIDGSNVPISNFEETIFLVVILKRKFSLEQIEESMPGVCLYIDCCNFLTSCYYGAGQHFDVLNLIRKSLTNMLQEQST